MSALMRMAEETPPERDRYVDFLRGFSISVVVLGHWLIAVVTWKDGQIEGVNALEVISGLWLATWVLQVMPLFFFVGGFSNLRTWDAAKKRGAQYADFLNSRIVRMMRPTIVFLGIGLVVTTILDALNVADNVVFPASRLITRPLWFLGVYMIVVALAPLMISLHHRWAWRVPVALAAVALVIDILRFGADISAFGFVNYAVVWLLAHQLGFLYADGTLTRLRVWVVAAGGLAALVVIVNIGTYPGSMVGLSTDEFSNMDPPTIAMVALMVWQIGAVMVLRGPVSRWLARPRNWAGVIYVNSVIMTMFLWHLTAMLFGIGILFPLGFPQPDAGTAQWWLLRPVWVALLLVLLTVFVVGFGRFEQRGLRSSRETLQSNPTSSRLAAALGGTLVILGVLGFAMGGLHQLFSTEGTELIIFNLNPLQNVLHLALGGFLLAASVRSDETIRNASSLGAVVLAVLVVVGLAMADGGLTNYLAANTADNLLHIVALSITGAVAFSLRRQPEKHPI